jgi:uncharacterized protein
MSARKACTPGTEFAPLPSRQRYNDACLGLLLSLHAGGHSSDLIRSAPRNGHRMGFRIFVFVAAQYNYFASILVSIGWVGLVMLACKSTRWPPSLGRVAGVGRTAFSNYILQTLICTTIFYGYGFGKFGKVARTTQIEIVVLIWTLQLVISPIWLEMFHHGPLEWVWRSLTYGKRQPFLRASKL